jgi:hypothetical protein
MSDTHYNSVDPRWNHAAYFHKNQVQVRYENDQEQQSYGLNGS